MNQTATYSTSTARSGSRPVRLAELHDLFTQRGLRCTRQRVAVYEALAGTTAHPTADQLYHEVSNHVRGVSLATVYNTLEAFCEVGLAQKLPANGGSARYDATVDNHLHARCATSGAVHDVPADLGQRLLDHIPGELLQQIEASLRCRIRQIRIELVTEPRKKDE